MKPKTAGCRDAGRHFAHQDAKASHPGETRNEHVQNGLVWGSQITTLNGLTAVQDVRVGQRVLTRDRGAAHVQEIRTISCVTRAVYVIAGSLGHDRPDRDALLPAAQTILLRDWRARAFGNCRAMLLPASDLIDGEFIRDMGYMPMTLYQIFCGKPEILYVDGLEVGTADMQPTFPVSHPFRASKSANT